MPKGGTFEMKCHFMRDPGWVAWGSPEKGDRTGHSVVYRTSGGCVVFAPATGSDREELCRELAAVYGGEASVYPWEPLVQVAVSYDLLVTTVGGAVATIAGTIEVVARSVRGVVGV